MKILRMIAVFGEKKAENPEAADIIDQIISGYDWVVKEITGAAEISTAANCKVDAVIDDVKANDEPVNEAAATTATVSTKATFEEVTKYLDMDSIDGRYYYYVYMEVQCGSYKRKEKHGGHRTCTISKYRWEWKRVSKKAFISELSDYGWTLEEFVDALFIDETAEQVIVEDDGSNDEPEDNDLDGYVGIDEDSDDDDELIDEALQDVVTIIPTATAPLENKVAQLEKSIAYDEQELEALKAERDRIMENIARLEAKLNAKQKQLESLQATVTVEATATSDASTTTFSVNESTDAPISGGEIDSADTITMAVTVETSTNLSDDIAYWANEVEHAKTHLKLARETLARKEEEIAKLTVTLNKKRQTLDAYLEKLSDNRKTA